MAMASKAMQKIREKASWAEMTEADIAVISKEYCKKCIFKGGWGSRVHCDYLNITGHMRGCRPDNCDKFQSGSKKKVKVYPRLDVSHGKNAYGGGSRIRKEKTYIGLIIDDYLVRNNMQQKTLGEKIGVSGQAIGDWRRLKSKPKRDSLEKLSEVIGVPVEEIQKAIERGKIT